ncbi:hypothetical protein STIUS_v1c03030 [Spiroplasma sp. TIUS-1]|uniref:hypothetical protein n=1 Tax=Spiroplasma sp. TIUS-1 TaxID=216963 RepID=UPI00139843A9|nr:hypothetical protein [Spiroplasma sp. TIUS-1]QHX35857.1 hypothetical protein STIUS_v1c03030 [Spiroplasma sp. TIUS-1]
MLKSRRHLIKILIIFTLTVMFAGGLGADWNSARGIVWTMFYIVLPIFVLIGSILGLIFERNKLLQRLVFVATWVYALIGIIFVILGIWDLVDNIIENGEMGDTLLSLIHTVLFALIWWIAACFGLTAYKSMK